MNESVWVIQDLPARRKFASKAQLPVCAYPGMHNVLLLFNYLLYTTTTTTTIVSIYVISPFTQRQKEYNMKVIVFLCCLLQMVLSKNISSWCELPPDTTSRTGISCAALFYKWTFNSTSKACERYDYGGCGATENLFTNEEECMTKAQESGCLPL